MWYLYLDVVVLACTCTWECYLQVLILTRLSYWKCKHIIFYFATTIQITGNFMPLPYSFQFYYHPFIWHILCICCNLCKWFEFFMHLQQFESCCVCNIQLHCLFSSCYFCFFLWIFELKKIRNSESMSRYMVVFLHWILSFLDFYIHVKKIVFMPSNSCPY